MSDEEPFFIARNGAIWLAWSSGKSAISLGSEAEILNAMRQYIAERDGSVSATPPANSAAPNRTASTASNPPMDTTTSEPREEQARASERHELTIIGKLYTGTGSRDVTVLDLSETGCRFHDRFGRLEAESRVTIKLGPIGPVAATVKWCRQEYVGLQLDSPLYPSVLDHIRDHFDLRRRNPT